MKENASLLLKRILTCGGKAVFVMTKKQLWQIFMKTGKVSDYLNYKNARDEELSLSLEDEEFSEEFAQDLGSGFDVDFPECIEEYEDVNQNGRFGDS